MTLLEEDPLAQSCSDRSPTVLREFAVMRDNIQLTDPSDIGPIVDKLVEESVRKFETLALRTHREAAEAQ